MKILDATFLIDYYEDDPAIKEFYDGTCDKQKR
jgi:hypothetical protein